MGTSSYAAGLLVVALMSGQSWAQAPDVGATPDPASPNAADDADAIVVTGVRPRGSVPGDFTPIATLDPDDIAATGARNAAEVLEAIAPQTGSARGRGDGPPVVLLNGRRTSGFGEVQDLPSEAILRVEVFTEDVALQYGYPADQRVVNFILRPLFAQRTAEGRLGDAQEGARRIRSLEGGALSLNEGARQALTVVVRDEGAITELDAGIRPPSAGPDTRDIRTVVPETQSFELSGNLVEPLSERIFAGAGLRAEGRTRSSGLGRNALTGQGIHRDSRTTLTRLNANLDGQGEGWQWTTTASLDLGTSQSVTSGAVLGTGRTRTETSLLELNANANGGLIRLPAGRLRLSARAGFLERQLSSESEGVGGRGGADLERRQGQGRLTLTAPLFSQQEDDATPLGDITVNLTGAVDDLSDFGTLSEFGGGGSWSPLQGLTFSVQASRADSAPSLEQLGDPFLATPGVVTFDPLTGTSVSVTQISGGNAALDAEERRDVTLTFSFSPRLQGRSFGINGSFVRNRTDGAIVSFPSPTAATEAAFPDRFVRDAAGGLVQVDQRPLNLARRDSETLRWGVSFFTGFGPEVARRGPGGPPGASGGGSRAEGRPPPTAGGGGRGGMRGMGGGPPRAGRFNFSVTHVVRLEDTAVLREGQPALDLLGGQSLGGGAGQRENQIEFEGGLIWRGIGLRAFGNWIGEGRQVGTGPSGDLAFEDRLTLNLRAFVNFDDRTSWVESWPVLRGTRLVVAVENATDDAGVARDSLGRIPAAYQAGFRAPEGRRVEVRLRRQF